MSKLLRSILPLAVVAVAANLTGCASIVSGTSQIVSVETLQATNRVDGASCKLENEKGVYYVTTPGTVTVRRAYGDMTVRCEKPGMDAGVASIKSSTKGMAFGNVIFGGVIGAGVDVASGAAYDYPNLFQIMMGQTTVIAAPAAPQAAAKAPAAGAPN
ncbi:hypothetical protein [Massilia sp. IC2-476]|uniref:hypothetical protein n=1 Tax=Massilia sp. IC2-476 TaxID=2887199 RepID=UPI001D0FEE5D|nr:hypothetical protein [Massilia sp. IC2-476]MCC2974313.1 hypothetical protein [Massilia sp. IC2-476]